MKYFVIIIMLSFFVFSKTINCVVPHNIVTQVKPLFKDKIAYNKLEVTIQISLDNKEALRYLAQKEKAKFAIIRRDVLWQVQQTKGDLSNSYILISELPFSAMLYLVQGIDSCDIDLDSLQKKQVSIGSLGEFSNLYLKALLGEFNIKNSILYKSLVYKKSIQQIQDGKLDAYFGFLLSSVESRDFHFQTLFSEQTVKYFRNKNVFNIDYNGISSPYILVASVVADDEEIESIIYRLMEKELFVPVTDERFGIINRYVLNHLEEVKKTLNDNYENNIDEVIQLDYSSKMCRKYHYGFLKLLRQKPRLKKQLRSIYDEKKRKIFLKKINSILIYIDQEKENCNLKVLKRQKENFNRLKEKINILDITQRENEIPLYNKACFPIRASQLNSSFLSTKTSNL